MLLLVGTLQIFASLIFSGPVLLKLGGLRKLVLDQLVSLFEESWGSRLDFGKLFADFFPIAIQFFVKLYEIGVLFSAPGFIFCRAFIT